MKVVLAAIDVVIDDQPLEDAPTLSLEEAIGPKEEVPRPHVPDIHIKPPTLKLSKELRDRR
jgi:hypothetical protein